MDRSPTGVVDDVYLRFNTSPVTRTEEIGHAVRIDYSRGIGLGPFPGAEEVVGVEVIGVAEITAHPRHVPAEPTETFTFKVGPSFLTVGCHPEDGEPYVVASDGVRTTLSADDHTSGTLLSALRLLAGMLEGVSAKVTLATRDDD